MSNLPEDTTAGKDGRSQRVLAIMGYSSTYATGDGDLRTMSWPAGFAEILTPIHTVPDKLKAPAIGPGLPVEGGKRQKSDMVGADVLMFDFVRCPGLTGETIIGAIPGHAWAAWTGWSCTEEAMSLTLALPLSRRVSPQEYKTIQDWASKGMADKLGVPLFDSKKEPQGYGLDLARNGIWQAYPLLCMPAEGAKLKEAWGGLRPVYRVEDGKPVQVDNVLEKARSEGDEAVRRERQQAVQKAVTGLMWLRAQVEAAEGKPARVEALSALLGNEICMVHLAEAYVHDEAKVAAELQRLRAIRGLAAPVDDLVRMVKKGAAEVRARQRKEESQDISPGLVAASLPDAPLGDRLLVPGGWKLTGTGTFEVQKSENQDGPKEYMVAPSPILIIGRMIDVNDGTTWWLIAWRRDGRWIQRNIPRERGSDARALVGEAKHDLPVNSNNAGVVVKYLGDFETVNLDKIPRANVSRSMGWQGRNGELGYLWGRMLIRHEKGDQVSDLALDEEDPSTWSTDTVHFHADQDDGAAQLADAFTAGGTYQGWREAVLRCTLYPKVMVALYAGLVSPLLPLVPEVANFVINWSGVTSTGKTTTLRVPASAWGRPDERAGGCLLTWDMTRVAIERTGSIIGHIPLILDDTKRAKWPKMVPQVIYDLCSGRGRMRGSITGMQRTVSTRSVMLSTGESPATSSTEDGGSRARVIEVSGPPFEGTDEATSKLVVELTQALMIHYGHAGPMMVKALHARQEKWKGMPKVCRDLTAYWLGLAKGHPVASRVAAYFGILELAGAMAHQLFDLPGDVRKNLKVIWELILESVADADPPRRALRQLRAWAASNAARFWGRHEVIEGRDFSNIRIPNDGWAGAWERGPSWDHIAFIPTVMEKTLRELGHEPEGILQAWFERGWLDTDTRRRKRKATVYQGRARCYCVRREAFQEAGEDGPPEERPVDVHSAGHLTVLDGGRG